MGCSMKSYIFLTFNDFSQDDGGTIRMRGIVNALAEHNECVTLISNTQNYFKFDSNIEHIHLDYHVTKKYKQIFQISLSLLPQFVYRFLSYNFLNKMKNLFENNNIDTRAIFFFEYFDNSVGCFLKKNHLIKDYINDMHGIAPLEYKHKNIAGIIQKLENNLKLKIVTNLDKKVILEAKKLLFVSEAMKQYYEEKYPEIARNHNLILRDGTTKELCSQKVDAKLLERLHKKYHVTEIDNIILFIGDFKDFGGIIDLIKAFVILEKDGKMKNIKLLLIGNGERYLDAVALVSEYNLDKKIIFMGRISYSNLRTYQELGDVIVCPDKAHRYSELVPHIKYFDSLLSEKIVVNGDFQSIREIDRNEKFSILFDPSNINDLADKIQYALQNRDMLKSKFMKNKDKICKEYVYSNTVKVLM